MYGFIVTKDGKRGTVVSSPDFSIEGTSVVVVWDDQSFTVEWVVRLSAVAHTAPSAAVHDINQDVPGCSH